MCIKRECTGKRLNIPIRNPRSDSRSRKNVHRKGQEARLYIACVASITLPAAMLMFAWTARPDIPWIVPAIGLTVSSNMPMILPISLMAALPAFLGLRFRYISSRVHLLGRLVSAFILVLLHSDVC